MRKSSDSLAALVREGLGYDPLSGHLLVFRSRRGDRIKLLWWDRDGLALYYRRLEEGTFRFPTTGDPNVRSIEVSAQELSLNLVELPPETSEQLDWRKFHESRRLDPTRMEAALAWIGKLYAVEKDLRERRATQWQDLPLEEQAARVVAERQTRSRPLLEDFHGWLESAAPQVLPKNAARAAIEYTLGNWTALCRYTQSGWLDIDNNAAENALRGIALGRKNWLFCGSDRGGRAAAIHFSLLASCKRHGHDPFAYLRDVLTRLPMVLPGAREEELLALLPHRRQTP